MTASFIGLPRSRKPGNWRAVLMNADGTRGVAADLQFGAAPPSSGGLALGGDHGKRLAYEPEADARESTASMSRQASGLRERIRLAIETPVGEAERLLNELKDADTETRLSILISGWSRGLASALEELAIAVDELQQPRPHAKAETSRATPAEESVSQQAEAEKEASHDDLEEAGEERLIDEARRSREQTAELHEQTQQARRELEG